MKAVLCIERVVVPHFAGRPTMEGQVAAQMKDDGHQPSVKLVRARDFARVVENCKNPPKPSAALVKLFAAHKAK